MSIQSLPNIRIPSNIKSNDKNAKIKVIKCKYCNTLTNDNFVNCKNCGANEFIISEQNSKIIPPEPCDRA